MTIVLDLQASAVEASLQSVLDGVSARLSTEPLPSVDPAALHERVAEASASIARVREEADGV